MFSHVWLCLCVLRSAGVLLNLFSLMVDANIPDIALEPDKTVRKVQDKLCLDRSDEEAVQYLQGVIDASASDNMAVFHEYTHKLAQVSLTGRRCFFSFSLICAA